MSDTIRKLASIRKIENISDIPGADMISMATIDGWEVVVKKGDFKPGDHVIYLEIDSWVPTTVAPFLTKSGKTPREYNGVPGERLKTVRFRGQISQGLILNYWNFPDVVNAFHKTRLVNHWDNNDFDVTEILGIQKWEPEIDANLSGRAKGNFPYFIPKTDSERCISEGTLITTDTGNFPIEYVIKNGIENFKILTYNHSLNLCEYKNILNYSIMRNANNWIKIKTKKGGILVVTTNHKIWNNDINAYREAQEFKVGDKIIKKM